MDITLLRKKTYIAMIQQAAKDGTGLFRHVFARVNGREEDIVRSGERSCAFFVSSVLLLNKLCSEVHTGTDGLLRDLTAFGWGKIGDVRPGAVLVWDPRPNTDGEPRVHVGFSLSESEAVSNDSNGTGISTAHHITYGTSPNGAPLRGIQTILWHKKLDRETW